jgi:Ca2+-binding RTX toxin-like protein
MAFRRGTSGSDILRGTRDFDEMFGFGGDDTLLGLAGFDLMDGGGGNDRLSGGLGVDILFGKGGSDRLSGGPHDDRLDGGPGNDDLAGGRGSDYLNAGSGANRIDLGSDSDSDLVVLARDNYPDTIENFHEGDDEFELAIRNFELSIANDTDGDGIAEANSATPQLVFEGDRLRLWFDGDGTGAAEAKLLVRFDRDSCTFLADDQSGLPTLEINDFWLFF